MSSNAEPEQRGPYERAARAYLKAGWARPIPLGVPSRGEPSKWPPPDDTTGYGAKDIAETDIDEWIDTHGALNLGLHMHDLDVDGEAWSVVGLDADDYDGKTGSEVLAGIEAEIGELPPTVRSSARGKGNPGGIRFFRVPEGTVLVSKLKGGVEIIQASHRYAVAWPSVHPDTGTTYEWYAPSGKRLGRPPRCSALPELPPLWLHRLMRGASQASSGEQADLTRDEVVAWLNAHGNGSQCRAVRGVLRKELAALAEAEEMGTSRYDTAVASVWALTQLALEGHLGVREAVYAFGHEYRELLRNEPNRDTTEWQRMVTGAVEKAQPVTEAENQEPAHDVGDCPERDPQNWPSPQAPLDVARRYVSERWMVGGHGSTHRGGTVTLRRWRGEFYAYTGTHYEPISEESLTAELGAILADVEYTGAGATASVLRWNPTPAKLKAVSGMLASVPGVLRSDADEPDDTAGEVISLRNGLLTVDGRTLRPNSPEHFALHSLPFDYSADAQCPEWERFLGSVWPEDGDAIDLLQEWFGHVASGSLVEHKMMMLLGPPRSGKGVITRTLENLVGVDAATSVTFDSFGQNFGLAPVVGKLLVTIPDARFEGRNQAPVVERLLSISGGDRIQVDRKNRDAWVGRLSARVMVVSNEMPMLREASGALLGRFVGPLTTHRSYLGREDLGLEERLEDELSGIFAWALDGLDALHEQGRRFTNPASAKEARREWVELNAPIEAFVRQCCTTAMDDEVEIQDLYDAYVQWAHDAGVRPTSKPRLSRDLKASRVARNLRLTQVRRHGQQVRVAQGIGLLPEDRRGA